MQGEGFEKQADAEMRRLSEAAAGLVVMAKRLHPYPSRTRKLSSSAPMVIGGCPPVRVGRCQANIIGRGLGPYRFHCLWRISSAGRAPALQAGGRRFDPVILHHFDFYSAGVAQLVEQLTCNQ